MSAAMSLQIPSPRPEGGASLAGVSRRSGRLADRPGGPGDGVNRGQRPAADISCLACWLSLFTFWSSSFLFHIGFSLRSFSRSFLHHIRFSPVSPRYFLFASLFVVLVSPGCISARRSDSQMLRVLEAEAELLERLKEERRHPPLLKALHGDEAVAGAEARLRDAIDALIRANAEMQTTLKRR